MATERRKEQNRSYKEFRKAHGICQRCMNDVFVDPVTGKAQTLCEFHRIANGEQTKRRKSRDLTRARLMYRKHNANRSARKASVANFLSELYAEIDRQKDLEAAGDAKAILFAGDFSNGKEPHPAVRSSTAPLHDYLSRRF